MCFISGRTLEVVAGKEGGRSEVLGFQCWLACWVWRGFDRDKRFSDEDLHTICIGGMVLAVGLPARGVSGSQDGSK